MMVLKIIYIAITEKKTFNAHIKAQNKIYIITDLHRNNGRNN